MAFRHRVTRDSTGAFPIIGNTRMFFFSCINICLAARPSVQTSPEGPDLDPTDLNAMKQTYGIVNLHIYLIPTLTAKTFKIRPFSYRGFLHTEFKQLETSRPGKC